MGISWTDSTVEKFGVVSAVFDERRVTVDRAMCSVSASRANPPCRPDSFLHLLCHFFSDSFVVEISEWWVFSFVRCILCCTTSHFLLCHHRTLRSQVIQFLSPSTAYSWTDSEKKKDGTAREKNQKQRHSVKHRSLTQHEGHALYGVLTKCLSCTEFE